MKNKFLNCITNGTDKIKNKKISSFVYKFSIQKEYINPLETFRKLGKQIITMYHRLP
jgi:hypothetical protein